MLRRLRYFWRNVVHRREVERALREELGAYVELLTAEKVAGGMTAERARRAARAECGVVLTTEAVRESRTGAWLDAWRREIGQAVRSLRRARRFTGAAILTLTIGLGASTAIFAVVNAALVRPLPFPHPDRLAILTEYNPRKTQRTGASYPDLHDWQQQNVVFSTLAGYWNLPDDGVIVGAGTAERVHYAIVTNALFPVLGIRPAIGRTFAPSEGLPGRGKVFIASDALWHRAFGGRTDAVGRAFRIDGEPYVLIGVLAPRVQFPDDCDVWFPLGTLGRLPADRISHQFWAVGRLRAGVTLQRAQSDMSAIAGRLAGAYPGTNTDWQVSVRPLLDDYVGDVRTALLVLLGAVGFILLIACASVANLTLARALTRDREFAIRTALGASRGRLILHCLVESAVVTGAGLVLAAAFTMFTRKLVFAVTTIGTFRAISDRLDFRVWVFGALGAVVTSLVIGMVPALHAIRRMPYDSLRATPSGGVGRRARRVQHALVVIELAVTLVLLAGAGLMARTLVELRRVDPGFDPDRLMTMEVALPDALYPSQSRRVNYSSGLLTRVSALPGIRSAALADAVPFGGDPEFAESFNVAGEPVLDWATASAAVDHQVSATYLATLRIPLRAGRLFTDRDSNVVVISHAMADAFWPGQDPIHRRIATLDEPTRWLDIIGVVGDMRTAGFDQRANPAMYVHGQSWRHMSLVLRTDGDPVALIPMVRRTIAALDPDVAVYRMTTMERLMERSTGSRRLGLVVLAAFAGFALVIAAVGVFGLLAFAMSRRTREIGIRTALGARRGDILRSVGMEGARPVAIGVVLGVAAAVALTRFMRSLLFGVAPIDPLALGGAAALVAIVALIAAYGPIRRGLAIDPVRVLREE